VGSAIEPDKYNTIQYFCLGYDPKIQFQKSILLLAYSYYTILMFCSPLSQQEKVLYLAYDVLLLMLIVFLSLTIYWHIRTPSQSSHLQLMFPLSCARTLTGRETCEHKKTWSAHKCSLQKCFLHMNYFTHVIPYDVHER